ncbi:MAG TPA: AbrB/MazE/SpoVT family DNA-binding domain-containing protein [Acidobacteriaceae bacterium]|jgi:putative addiction module antidote
MKLKIRPVGTSAGIVIPKQVLKRLKLAKGDSVFLTESPDGFRITCGDPEFEEQMMFARRIMKKRRDALRDLAK